MAAPWHNVFVGSETGLLKGVNVQQGIWDNLNSVQLAGKEKEICAMCWGNDIQTEVCIGLKNRKIHIFNREENSFVKTELDCPGGKGKLKGLIKYDSHFLTAEESGLVKLWNDNEDQLEINAGDGLCCLSQNPANKHVIGVGGKENDLKLWNLQRPEQPVFAVKNVRNDWLNLRVPIWVLGIGFIPTSEKVVTCTGHHQVRVYDPSVNQRRPVLDMDFDEYPLTALSVCHSRDQYVMVGNTQGKMAQIDLRVGKMVHCFKGFAGGIRSIECHSSQPLVASCGLDRYLRIHDTTSKQLLSKFYLKSRLNCVLMTREWSPDEGTSPQEKESGSLAEMPIPDANEDSSGEEDAVWNNMEVVQTKTVKKKEKLVTMVTEAEKQTKTVKKRQKAEVLTESDVTVIKKKKKSIIRKD